MQWPVAILGRGIVAQLQARTAAPLLTIGSDRYTRADLAQVECFNFVAAANLAKVIAALDVRNTRDLYEHVEPEHFAVPGVGAFALAVLGACFEHKGVGTLDGWVTHSRNKGERVTTFNTMKEHVSAGTTTVVRRPKSGKRKRANAADATSRNGKSR